MNAGKKVIRVWDSLIIILLLMLGGVFMCAVLPAANRDIAGKEFREKTIDIHGEIYEEMLSITDKVHVLADYNARNTHYADPNHGTDRPLCPECQNAPLISLETLKADLGDLPLDEVAVTQEQIYDDTVELLMFAKRIDDSLTNITFPTIHTYECLKK